jgi:DNA-binding NtrC family response regulator
MPNYLEDGGMNRPMARSASAARSGVHPKVERLPARILVIDDEPMIGSIFVTALADHAVEAFVDPSAAVARAAVAPFDMVFCDLCMPNMTGTDVFAALEQCAPALVSRFILMTGSLGDVKAASFLATHRTLLLSKPFRLAELEHLVTRVLDCAL